MSKLLIGGSREGDRVEESRKLRSNSKYRGCVLTRPPRALAGKQTDTRVVHFEQGH